MHVRKRDNKVVKRALGTRVSVQLRGKIRGKIVVDSWIRVKVRATLGIRLR